MTTEELIRKKKERGCSTAQLSERTGVPVGTLTKILSGETKNPRIDTMRALEDYFRETPAWPGDMGRSGDSRCRPGTLMLAERALAFGVPEKRQGSYTLEDMKELPEGRLAELIDGVLYDMASPTFPHQSIAQSVFVSVFRYISEQDGSCRVSLAPVDVFLDCDDRTCVIPDLFIVCGREKLTKKGVFGAPDFILEVVSPSSEGRDKVIKAEKYMRAGVREYWIIDPEKKLLVVYDYKEPMTYVLPLKGKRGIGIFGGQPEIDLDRLREMAEEFG